MKVRMRSRYERFYRVIIDGKPSKIELIGENKSEAYEDLEWEWSKYFPGVPCPARSRCRLEKIEEVRWG